MRLGVQAALVDGELLPGDVELADGRIAAVGLASPDGRGIAVPGFVDLQVNGFGGVDFLEADAAGYARAGDALLETGVTGYLPTLITSSEEHLVAALARGAAASRQARGSSASTSRARSSRPLARARIRRSSCATRTRTCSCGCSRRARSGSSRSPPSFRARTS